MTYRQLLKELNTLSVQQLDDDVTVLVGNIDEYFPVVKVDVNFGEDVLHDQHAFLLICPID